VYEPDANESWPVRVGGFDVAFDDWSGAMVIDPRPGDRLASPDDSLRDDTLIARFGNGIELLGLYPRQCRHAPDVQWQRTIGTAGREPERALVTWSPSERVDEDLTVFIHLVDEQGDLVEAFDRPPATHGPYRTSLWLPGDPVPAELPWWLPEDAPDGATYTVRVGLYRPTDGSRVPAFRPDGDRWPDDAVELLTVTARSD
jgi:hypothetical protein